MEGEKKQKLAEKAAREAELAAKKVQARQALSIYLTLPSLDEAVNTLETPRVAGIV